MSVLVEEARLSKTNKSDVSLWDVFYSFLTLGCTSFGGPVAHIGFFREAFVGRKAWLDDKKFGDFLALCQFIPGPASSQLGMAIGYAKHGHLGALAAWLGFTLPSAIVLAAFAAFLGHYSELASTGLTKGLKLVALAVVLHAFLDMRSKLAPDLERLLIMIACAVLFVSFRHPLAPVAVLTFIGLMSTVRSSSVKVHEESLKGGKWRDGSWRVSRVSLLCLLAFFLLLAVPPFLPESGVMFDQFAAYYRSGALVFGGGHVVLPLLELETVPTGWVSSESFLTGYGAAQAVPGPLFTFASFLGFSHTQGASGILGWALATVSIFLPSFLLLFGVLPYWEKLRHNARVRSALNGVNAAVLGLLLATIYDPLLIESIDGAWDLVFALLSFALLRYAKVPVVPLVLVGASIGFIVF